ncbi:hypothetical protein SAMN05421788_108291 [Filimonas lacunae]|uniref:Polymerase nucleotidyl transferase domain-containing protein n=1 Tax=Filimonas lacunae TaxID=477680 RepID=A0A173MDL0_9BACT|nr:nucleotidyltransferase domain-containing protein [Filimonas lacunae]BAV05569.1 hypothetical protein FLA_1576 [Filimonas lacunae]SIT29335.1 hypothetical protein SAMN05421788_108291 [Filimonas lacunae]
MPEVKEDILTTLTYFDNFRYPLTAAEILSFLPNICSRATLEIHLAALLQTGTVFQVQGYYSLCNDAGMVQRRITGYQKAMPLIRTAEKIAGLLSAFPYVRGVAISGSLSKGYADEHSDIDFFIITAGNRLWLARTFTHIAKKISFLLHKQHLFCMNYYIDEYYPEIVEQNIFTATEVVTLMPVKGMAAFIVFNQANGWARRFLPNHPLPAVPTKMLRHNLLARGIEKLLNSTIADWLDNRLMLLTEKRWTAKKQAGKRDDHGRVMSMHSGKHYSKPDPTFFQEKLMNNYRQRAREIIRKAQPHWMAAIHPDATEPYNS